MKGDRPFFLMTIAHRVLSIGPGLKLADRVVGSALLGHYNTKTGRLDPSVDRLSSLLGMHRASIFRSLGRLIKAGFFERERYGGRSHRNSYKPNWDRFLALNKQMNNKPPNATVAAVHEPSHQDTGEPSQGETTNVDCLNDESSFQPLDQGGPTERPKCQAGGSKPSRQGFLLLALKGGRSASHQEAAEAAAHRRLQERINALPLDEREPAWLAAMQAGG